MPILPDVLAPGLKVVFCGLTAGSAAAAAGAYYAGPGNWFWPLLFEVGLTTRCCVRRSTQECSNLASA